MYFTVSSVCWKECFLNEQFIEELNRYDVRKFDADHILIPPMTKADLENLAEKLRGKGRFA